MLITEKKSEEIMLGKNKFKMEELDMEEFLKLKNDFMSKTKDNTPMNDVFNSFITDYLPIIIKGVTKEDLLKSYSSQLEQAVETFKDLNFHGFKKIIGLLGTEWIKTFLKDGITSFLTSN